MSEFPRLASLSKVLAPVSAVVATALPVSVFAQASKVASGASAVIDTVGPPRVPYLFVLAVVAVVAVVALYFALRALSEVRELKKELNGMKNR